MVPLWNSKTPNYELPNIILTQRKRHTCRGLYTRTNLTWPLRSALWLLRIACFHNNLSGTATIQHVMIIYNHHVWHLWMMQQPSVWKMSSFYLLRCFKSVTQVFVLHKTDQWLLLQLYIICFFHGHLNVAPVNYIVGSVGRMFI